MRKPLCILYGESTTRPLCELSFPPRLFQPCHLLFLVVSCSPLILSLHYILYTYFRFFFLLICEEGLTNRYLLNLLPDCDVGFPGPCTSRYSIIFSCCVFLFMIPCCPSLNSSLQTPSRPFIWDLRRVANLIVILKS